MSSNEIIFITGANTGLGYETVKSLLQSSKPYTILLGGRSLDKANTAAENARKDFPETPSTIKTIQIDIEDDASIAAALEKVTSEYGYVDVLINNGGKLYIPPFEIDIPNLQAGGQFETKVMRKELTVREMWNKSWNVNTTGTYILTYNFVPLLLKSSSPRLLFITSGLSTLGEHGKNKSPLDRSPPKGWPKEPMAFGATAYRSSKTGMNMMAKEWERVLKEDGVKVWAISPGFLATGLGLGVEFNKKFGAIDPSIGANFVRDVVEGKDNSGYRTKIGEEGC